MAIHIVPVLNWVTSSNGRDFIRGASHDHATVEKSFKPPYGIPVAIAMAVAVDRAKPRVRILADNQAVELNIIGFRHVIESVLPAIRIGMYGHFVILLQKELQVVRSRSLKPEHL